MNLANRIALVTGAAHRLGRAIALGLAEQGCDLVVHYHHSNQAATETIAAIEAQGVRAVPAPADLSQLAGVQELFRTVDQTYGGLDMLVNSAAIMQPVDLLSASEEDWERAIGLNLKGAFFCLQQAAKRIRARGGGAIVNISDVAGIRPWKRYPIHSISKAGIEMMTKVAALALAPDIRVNAIAPGPVLKPSALNPSRWQAIAGSLPLKRSGSPEDIVRTVIFLLENDYITGETVIVDGGAWLK